MEYNSNMIKIENKTIQKMGTGYGFHIPVAFIRHGGIDPKKKYNVVLEEVQGAAN